MSMLTLDLLIKWLSFKIELSSIPKLGVAETPLKLIRKITMFNWPKIKSGHRSKTNCKNSLMASLTLNLITWELSMASRRRKTKRKRRRRKNKKKLKFHKDWAKSSPKSFSKNSLRRILPNCLVEPRWTTSLESTIQLHIWLRKILNNFQIQLYLKSGTWLLNTLEFH